ncbi:MAG TPA: energy transducer TonB [Terracidiphilus sp.]|nr:energy transducer TonB [Terracidiphilus sp.]
MPTQLTVARHTFFDFGPPNDFYEIINVAPNGNELSVQRALVTPPGIACIQPAKVELSSGILHESMEELLQSKNPCAIPEKELRRERQRCKKCLVFSGVDVTMQVNCAGKDRQIRTDILDRDLFDSASKTPKNTSWSMAVLQRLDSTLGPGVMDKPIFSVDTTQPAQPVRGNLIDQILAGTFDPLFGPQTKVSAIAQDAAKEPPPPPTIQIETVSPFAPLLPELPKYPPIAKLARLEGLVQATFEVGEDGVIRNISFVSEPRLRMLQPAVSESISKWKFSQSAWGKNEKASIRFQLNCNLP